MPTKKKYLSHFAYAHANSIEYLYKCSVALSAVSGPPNTGRQILNFLLCLVVLDWLIVRYFQHRSVDSGFAFYDRLHLIANDFEWLYKNVIEL